jgi:hypothetical protein
VTDWRIPLGFVPVAVVLQFGAIWDTGEPQARTITAARKSRKQENGRP